MEETTGTRVPNLNLYGDSTNGISSKLKMHENIEKTRFYKIVLVTISINRDYIYTNSNEHNFIKSCFFDVFMHFELR